MGNPVATIEDWAKNLDKKAAYDAEVAASQSPKTAKKLCNAPVNMTVQRVPNQNKWVHINTTQSAKGKELAVYDAENIYVGNSYTPYILGVLFAYCAYKLFFGGRQNNHQVAETQTFVKADTQKCLPYSGSFLQKVGIEKESYNNCNPSYGGVQIRKAS